MSRDPYIVTASGRKFYLGRPDRSMVYLYDIATHLAKLCRFTGASVEHYSVAQHSVYVSRMCAHLPLQHRRWALLHDAAEAYIGDVSNPLKSILPCYRTVEARVEFAIEQAFDFHGPRPPDIKAADWSVFAAEYRDLMPPTDAVCNMPPGLVPMPGRIHPLDWRAARLMFVRECDELGLGWVL